ncbi:site-specific integrase [Paenibacillus sp. FJAT-26967]|uniref:tyrosine-type recombinase/integrase n=1 Tax=Paenibacillus sp. FJAT-26967 TaxID=1729690 RepID=UPI0015603C79|nr:site-specific integrase [Paenibacillus sp. FJAT-26967]
MPIYEYIKSKKVHYYYAFEVKDSNGKRKTIKQNGFTGKTEARLAEADARVKWAKGQHIDPKKITYAEYALEWYKHKHDVSERTREINEGQFTNHIFPVFGDVPLQKIQPTHIESMIKKLKEKHLADGTIKKVFNLVNTSLKAAVKKELIIRNPIDLMDSKPRTKKGKTDFWTKEEVIEFLSKMNHRLRILFVLAIYTGMRRGEILALQWKDVDLDKGQVRISKILDYKTKVKNGTKTDAGYRSISIPPYVIGELKKHKKLLTLEKWKLKESYIDNDLIVCRSNGQPVSWSNFHKFWLRILEKTESRPIRFHDLRHTCASLLLSTGAHPKVVQELLGHSSIKITLDRYSHMVPNLQAEAVMSLEKMLN